MRDRRQVITVLDKRATASPFIWHYNTWLSQFLLFKMRQCYKTFYRRALKRRTKSTYSKYNLHCMLFLAHFHSVWKNAFFCSFCRPSVYKLFFSAKLVFWGLWVIFFDYFECLAFCVSEEVAKSSDNYEFYRKQSQRHNNTRFLGTWIKHSEKRIIDTISFY